METIGKKKTKELPVIQENANCNFEGYDALLLMSETAKLRTLITKRGTLEILIPLCSQQTLLDINNSDRP